ncbi:MAG TPA: cell division protein ZipA [Gammaproteobacteria bacterium]|nr:cell division protein ZipA [Gammaproteobacteria bacterium]
MDGLRLILILIGAVVIALIYLFSRRTGLQGTDDADPVQQDTEWMEEIARQRRKLSEREERAHATEPPAEVPVLEDRLTIPAPVMDAPETPLPEEPLPATGPDPAPAPAMQEEEKEAPAPAEKEPEEADSGEQPEPTPAAAPPELVLALHVTAPDGGEFEGAALFSALEENGLRFGEGGIFHYRQPDGEQAQNGVLFSVANMLEPGTFEAEGAERTFTTPGVALFMRAPGVAPAREMLEKMLLTAQQVAERVGGEIRDGRRQPLREATIQEMLDRATSFDRGTPGSGA